VHVSAVGGGDVDARCVEVQRSGRQGNGRKTVAVTEWGEGRWGTDWWKERTWAGDGEEREGRGRGRR